MSRYYKVLNADGTPCYGGSGQWHLPTADGPGKWMPEIKHIVLCLRGYHVVSREQVVIWLGPRIYECEVRGEIQADDDKSVVSQARLIKTLDNWNDKTVRLFAADCAERVLPIFEAKYPDDNRPRLAIDAARDFAHGRTKNENLGAAGAAARDAGDAAWAAAGAVAWAAGDATWPTARAAWAAARAAGAAAWAVGDAAWAAGDAERQWQTKRLWQYLDGALA